MIEQRGSLDVCKRLERQGFEVTAVPVQPDGLIDIDEIRRALTDKTILISVMFANNEIGTIQDIAAIGKLAKEKGILFHTDATQAVGKVPIDVEAMGIDLLSSTAHLIYGPKGVGALYVRRKGPRVRIAPQMDGGGHERGMRSGTLPVPLIVGYGRAAEICGESMAEDGARIARMRDRLQDMILSSVDEAFLNGSPDRRLAGNLNISFAYVEGESVLMGLNRETALSSGSACLLDAGALLRDRRARRQRGAGPLVDPLQPAPLQHRRGRSTWGSAPSRSSRAAGLRHCTSWQEGVDLKSIKWKAE